MNLVPRAAAALLPGLALATGAGFGGCEATQTPDAPTGRVVDRRVFTGNPGPAGSNAHAYVWVDYGDGNPPVRYRVDIDECPVGSLHPQCDD